MKALFQGVPIVVVAGLLLGAVLQPQLALSDDPAGPQTLMGVSARREPTDMAWTSASYSGPVPDYVLGTDWLRPPSYAPVEELAPPPEDIAPPPDFIAWTPPSEPIVDSEELVTAPPAYPSETGDILAGLRPAAPAPAFEARAEASPPV